MNTFSTHSISQLETLAPHIAVRLQFAEDIEGEFFEYQPRQNHKVYVCFGCGYPPPGVDGEWIVIEPSLERLKAFMKAEASSRLFSRKIRFFSQGDEVSLRELAWYIFDKPFEMLNGGAGDFVSFETQFLEQVEGTAHLFHEYADFGVLPYRNMMENLASPLSDPTLYQKTQKGCDAIVIGAAPSLDTHLDRLKTLHKHAVLIGCGSAIQLLKEHGIPLDFAAAVDPAPPLERYTSVHEGVPLVFLSRTASSVVTRFSGEKILVGSNGCHPIESYVLQQAGVAQLIQGGWNAATLGIEWARYLGCKRIYTVGVDATPSGYARGISGRETRSALEVRETKKWLEEVMPLPSAFVPLGNKISVVSKQYPIPIESIASQLTNEIYEAKKAVWGLLRGGKMSLLHSFELERNVFYQNVLSFLWNLWKGRFSAPTEKEKWEFYIRVLDEYERRD